MTKYQAISIIFSLLLLPTNLICAFWMLREAVNLTGTDCRELFKSASFTSSMRIRRRFLLDFFRKNSSNPQKSLRLFHAFCICTVPGLFALVLAVFAAVDDGVLIYAFVGNLALTAVNIALILSRKIFESKNRLTDKSGKKRGSAKNYSFKSIAVYTLVGISFFGIMLFFMLGISGISQSRQTQNRSRTAISIRADLITILSEKGYETANVPTTYWTIDEEKLHHVAAGVKGESRFEFYGYSDEDTVEEVYERIVNLTAQKADGREFERREASLFDGGKMTTMAIDGVYYIVMYKNDTVIYALSPDSSDEIREIAAAVGYFAE